MAARSLDEPRLNRQVDFTKFLQRELLGDLHPELEAATLVPLWEVTGSLR